MRKLTLLLLCLALGIGVCDAKKKNRGVYFRTDAEIVLDKPYFGLNVSNMIQVVLEADRNPASVRVETENVPAEAVSVMNECNILSIFVILKSFCSGFFVYLQDVEQSCGPA